MLDWMMVEGYKKLKEETQQREEATSDIWTCLEGREPEGEDKFYDPTQRSWIPCFPTLGFQVAHDKFWVYNYDY